MLSISPRATKSSARRLRQVSQSVEEEDNFRGFLGKIVKFRRNLGIYAEFEEAGNDFLGSMTSFCCCRN